ncbi:Heterokaryon incompatibility protein (HET) domain containing protein [Hyaloscypha variabilis]
MEDLMQYEPEHNFYRPLLGYHSFRLLILDPASSVSHPVSIRLQVAERATAPVYDAISYVWGDPTHKVTIACDGPPFQITFNSYWALVRIRSASHPRVLWADAICINQSDLQERSNQVTLMGSLYSNASRVYICMGDATDGNAFQVQTVVNETKALISGGHSLSVLLGDDPLRNDSRWHALARLTENSWFSRAWVVQEAALAKEPIVLYGRAEFGYRDLVMVVRWANASSWAIKFRLSTLMIHLEWADWRANAHDPAFAFVDLLSHASLLSSSDPRDKVYAFLGHPLAQFLTSNNLVKPDYQKSPHQVYLELSSALIQYIGLRVLTTVEHTKSTILENFPSWVTRWNVSLVMNDIFRVPNDRFRASAGLTASFSPSIARNNLILPGVLLDKVWKTFTIYVGEASGISLEETVTGERISFQALLRGACNLDGSTCRYPDRALALCTALCGGKSAFVSQLPRYAACLATMLDNGSQNQKNSYTQEDTDNALLYFGEVKAVCINRTFVVTENGFYSLTPLLTGPGDVACVFVGVDVPFILKPCGDAGLFKLLGESYVHGVMEGQVKEMVEREELCKRSVVIC